MTPCLFWGFVGKILTIMFIQFKGNRKVVTTGSAKEAVFGIHRFHCTQLPIAMLRFRQFLIAIPELTFFLSYFLL
jgi:hypothetical protein